MFVVGITGGIGSGKSFIANIFNHLGIAVYDADGAAKYLMVTDTKIINAIKNRFGNMAYLDNGQLNSVFISEQIFSDKTARSFINACVHPAVHLHFDRWKSEQSSAYVMKESAILFESKAYQYVNSSLCVSAPVDIRTKRIIKRNNFSEEKIKDIMSSQLQENDRNSRCNHIIINDELTPLLPQVLKLHEIFLEAGKK
jgi:dephospho-CoA kinase